MTVTLKKINTFIFNLFDPDTYTIEKYKHLRLIFKQICFQEYPKKLIENIRRRLQMFESYIYLYAAAVKNIYSSFKNQIYSLKKINIKISIPLVFYYPFILPRIKKARQDYLIHNFTKKR